jgi:hypothetical protein
MRTIATEELHGWAIAQRIHLLTKDVLRINQGSLYPALQRLEREGWIAADWGVSETKRRRPILSTPPRRAAAGWRKSARSGSDSRRPSRSSCETRNRQGGRVRIVPSDHRRVAGSAPRSTRGCRPRR